LRIIVLESYLTDLSIRFSGDIYVLLFPHNPYCLRTMLQTRDIISASPLLRSYPAKGAFLRIEHAVHL